MLKAFANAFKIPDLRKKILFTLAIIAVFRIGSRVPVPDLNFSALATLQNSVKTQGALQFIDLFSGGALTRFAVFSLGIMPYITSTIIMQLLTPMIPRLQALNKEGEQGRNRIQLYTHYLTVPLAITTDPETLAAEARAVGATWIVTNHLPVTDDSGVLDGVAARAPNLFSGFGTICRGGRLWRVAPSG